MGIPCIRTFKTCKTPPLYGRHGNPMFPGTTKRAFTWGSMSILHDFAAGLPHMESPCECRCISQVTWFSHVEGLFLVAVNMGIPCEQCKIACKHNRTLDIHVKQWRFRSNMEFPYYVQVHGRNAYDCHMRERRIPPTCSLYTNVSSEIVFTWKSHVTGNP